ncbi:hypothetical protein [Candidatus Entotheonella palauensis]|uniref:DUF3368 domain-containing protein n=1 Tax=Candidatus Entotheonella gemina TaxID=1429439 RepID=W4M1A0_9BACT|nr:hypothetical protein [Candidatus Entotheonella palauensis]ETX03965.1 MAG: hypothetical protein ETSY2_31550 [Candidatus Entotheonella gemina]
MIVVSNSSPLIAGAAIGLEVIFEALFAVSPLIDQLLATGFYVDEELVELVRRTAGEATE